MWEEIHGFISPSEYKRFLQFIHDQVVLGRVVEIVVDPDYCEGMICGGRWFQDPSSGEVWRLIEPDFPFKGLWERVNCSDL
ncbi:protein of unknown function [Pseudodesulfovibrio piezophilus C1TLV30]|uniref:Uncharacterized protein n=1 Tax=Pseudodesulfovibrio piezophilus (strain DSM 21447 / JCM 15486 / C1TLV30) TaxID=1322246 RepID=M1WM03_PSEP2|nr:protein of unknown function [Pseudodesulfovibrio piezophilus C1TLV30]